MSSAATPEDLVDWLVGRWEANDFTAIREAESPNSGRPLMADPDQLVSFFAEDIGFFTGMGPADFGPAECTSTNSSNPSALHECVVTSLRPGPNGLPRVLYFDVSPTSLEIDDLGLLLVSP